MLDEIINKLLFLNYSMKKFEFLEHTADIKFRVYGKTLKKIFENTALAISKIISKDKKILSKKKKTISLKGKDKEKLMYNFIDEIIYLLDAENFVVAQVKVKVKGDHLSAVFYGDDTKNYKNLDQIKSATYHEMYVKKTKSGWEAQAVVDV